MPQKPEAPATSIPEVLEKISNSDRAFSFDVTLELTTPSLRVGALRVHGKVETITARKK